jgi:predicted enzyme related to lactoylglutathione lyase
MLERDGFPPGVPCFIDTSQPDPEAAARFYGELLGWEFEDRMPADAPGRYLIAQLDGRVVAAIGSQPEGPPSQPAWTTYIAVADADAAARRVWNAGGQVLAEPFDVFAAGRMAVVADPAGATFCLWQPYARTGVEVVNTPGAWNWSDLNTRDPQGATTFYGAVFGWEADSYGDGGGHALLRLPGYGDFLEQRDADLRRRQAADGAPPGFEDAVAAVAPLNGSAAGPHWSVTFAVDDPDAVAAKAAELGGGVVAAPQDIPPVRVAVLSDPQGAVFAVSRYAPGAGGSA